MMAAFAKSGIFGNKSEEESSLASAEYAECHSVDAGKQLRFDIRLRV